MLSFVAPIDSKLSGSQLQFLRILKNALLMRSEDLGPTNIILLKLSEKIHPYLAMELNDLIKVVKMSRHPPHKVKMIKTMHAPSLGLTSKLATHSNLFIGSGDLTDYCVVSLVQAITRRHIKRGILLGNVITGLAPHIALYDMKHAIHTLKKLNIRNSTNVNIKACLLYLTRSLNIYDLIVTPGISLAKILKRFRLRSKIIPFKSPTIPMRFESPNPIKASSLITLGFISRYFPGKGLTQVIEAVKNLKQKKRFNLIIFGVNRDLIFRRLKEFHKIEVYESLDPISLTYMLRKVDILLYPSLIDSWAHIIPESLALGIPVITFDIEPFRNNFRRCKAVIRTCLSDSSKLVSELESLIEDTSFLNELKYQAYEYAIETFNPDKVVEEFTKIVRLMSELG